MLCFLGSASRIASQFIIVMQQYDSSQGTLTALSAFSKGQLVGMLQSAALLSPIAYVGQVTSPLATNAADDFLAEV